MFIINPIFDKHYLVEISYFVFLEILLQVILYHLPSVGINYHYFHCKVLDKSNTIYNNFDKIVFVCQMVQNMNCITIRLFNTILYTQTHELVTSCFKSEIQAKGKF